MSIKSKTLAIMIATALGVSFGASANSGYGGYGGHGGGYGGGWGGHEDSAGTDMTNDDGNQAGDDLTNIDLDFNKWIYKTYDWDLKVKVDTNLNHQNNFTFQGGHTGDTESVAVSDSKAKSKAGNFALMGQKSKNASAGLGLGAGLGVGAGLAGGNDGGDGGTIFDLGFITFGFHDNDDANGGDGGNSAGFGAGSGAGLGAGAGMAKLYSDQDLDQNAASASWSQAASVSMIQSGNNNLSNTGTMHGISVQGAVSGHSSVGNQSVNVNGSVQF